MEISHLSQSLETAQKFTFWSQLEDPNHIARSRAAFILLVSGPSPPDVSRALLYCGVGTKITKSSVLRKLIGKWIDYMWCKTGSFRELHSSLWLELRNRSFASCHFSACCNNCVLSTKMEKDSIFAGFR